MEKGGIAKWIIDFATALVGWITGSLYLVAVVAGTGLAAISGSGSADTAAMSSIMLPQMKKRNYNIWVYCLPGVNEWFLYQNFRKKK